jgi:hypothetical protein
MAMAETVALRRSRVKDALRAPRSGDPKGVVLDATSSQSQNSTKTFRAHHHQAPLKPANEISDQAPLR